MYIRKVVGATALLLLTIFASIVHEVVLWQKNFEWNTNNKSCYQFPNESNGKNGSIFDDISDANMRIEPARSIFFLVTTCSENNEITLNPRQACAIESAAFHNPNRNVTALFASPVGLAKASQPTTVAVFRSYSNIQFLNVNLETIVEGTLAMEFYQNGKLFTSTYLVEHMSDFLRLIVLYKFGGIYLDLDVVVQKNLDELPANFVGKESFWKNDDDSLNGAILGFQDDIGHKIMKLCLKEFVNNFRPQECYYNGPQLLTRVLEKRVCHTNLSNMTPERCWGLKVFPPKEFYPINYNDWYQYFSAEYIKDVLNLIKNSSVVHLWEKFSHDDILSKLSLLTAYEIIAEKNCPIVYEASGKYF